MSREFEIFYKDVQEGDFPSPEAEYMIKEPAPGGGFVESYFKNGLDMLDYIDREKMIREDSEPFPLSFNC
jgi:hypothetical protein